MNRKAMTGKQEAQQTSGLSWGKAARTVAMPGIVPRVRELFGEGFAYFAYFIALVYRSVGLLPATHAYVSPANIGRYGIRHVIGAAANNVVVKRENIDQIIVFFAIIAAMMLIILQFFYVLIALSIPTAMAAVGFSDLFVTQNPHQDLAFIFLDRVFGVPGIFGSCVATSSADCLSTSQEMDFGKALPNQSPEIPWAFHEAMHELFRFYSIALLVVAVLLFLYFIVAIVAETAQTGTPFGKRFNSVWAPVRMVVALGLLIPLGHGLNGAQYITLYSAKLGSGLATNGWVKFNKEANEAMLGQERDMIATPNVPRKDIEGLVNFIYFAKLCEHIEEKKFGASDIDAYVVRRTGSTPAAPLADAGFKEARDYKSPGGTITVSIGETEENANSGLPMGGAAPHRGSEEHMANYSKYLGSVKPACGQLSVQLPDPSEEDEGSYHIQKGYYETLQKLWQSQAISSHAAVNVSESDDTNAEPVGKLINDTANKIINGSSDTDDRPDSGDSTSYTALGGEDGIIAEGIDKQMEAAYDSYDGGNMPQELRERGWGAAGVWYNRIANMNGKMLTSARNVPKPKSPPMKMEYTCEQRNKTDESETGNCFEPTLSNGESISYPREGDEWAASVYSETHDKIQNQMSEDVDSDYFSSVIKFIFGTEGLMNLRDNRGVHPLAQLSGVGRSLIEATVRNLGIGIASAGIGGVTRIFSGTIGQLAGGTGAFFFTVSSIGLTAGFLLFYIIPFLPFIYFFFAVSKWVKGIFEAMVGAPLWALAHIRIDGQGLPGDAARSGYELMLEIFLRPIMIVFGLLAGISVFSAQVIILNDIFDLVTMNVTGFNSDEVAEGMRDGKTGAKALVENVRGPIDQLFFTVMYAIIIYLMATPSFKLVDKLPDNILRWMGSSVSSFADQQDDPAGNLQQYGAVAGAQIFSSGTSGMAGLSKKLGG